MEKASMLQQVQTISFLNPSGICGLTVVTERRTNHSSPKNHGPHGGNYHDTQLERARAELDNAKDQRKEAEDIAAVTEKVRAELKQVDQRPSVRRKRETMQKSRRWS